MVLNAAFCSVLKKTLCRHLSDLEKCPAFSERGGLRILWLKASQLNKVRASSH